MPRLYLPLCLAICSVLIPTVGHTDLDVEVLVDAKKHLFQDNYEKLYWQVSQQYVARGFPEDQIPELVADALSSYSACWVDGLEADNSSIAIEVVLKLAAGEIKNFPRGFVESYSSEENEGLQSLFEELINKCAAETKLTHFVDLRND